MQEPRHLSSRTVHGRAVKIIKAEGSGPWLCTCGGMVYVLGKRRDEGMVHHKDEDPWNNDRENLEVLHSRCHHSHHHLGRAKPPIIGDTTRARMTGVPKSPETRARLSDAGKKAWAEGRSLGRWKR